SVLDEGPRSAVGRYRLDGPLAGLLVDIGDEHLGPGGGQDQTSRSAYPAPCPRHNEGLTQKNSSHFVLGLYAHALALIAEALAHCHSTIGARGIGVKSPLAMTGISG